MSRTIKESDINHLRRLLGWVRCSDGVFQPPEEITDTYRMIVGRTGVEPSDDAKHRIMESYRRSASIPIYVRQALKALSKIVQEADGNIVDGEPVQRKLPPQMFR